MRNYLATCALLWAASCPVSGASDYSLQIGNVIWTGSPGGYQCFSSTAYPNTVNFNIVKNSSGTKPYAITASPSATTGTYSRQLSSGVDKLNYQLYTASDLSNMLKAPPVANSSQVISGLSSSFAGTVIPLSFTFYLPPNQMVPPGTYHDQITLSIFNAYNDNSTPQDESTVNLSVSVPPAASLCLVPTGGGFTTGNTSQRLDFGDLTPGKIRTCDLLVLQNTACDITLTASNHGVLKRTSAQAANPIPYTLQINGNTLDLSLPAIVNLPAGISASLDGTRMPIVVTIGDLTNATAGDYQEEITITLSLP